MSIKTETLQWIPAAERKPDCIRTVLCWGYDGFFTGWWADEAKQWIDCESGGVVKAIVTHWSEPRGPAC